MRLWRGRMSYGVLFDWEIYRKGQVMDKTRYGPKTPDHPTTGKPCPACREEFKEGDFTTLVTLGPGNDPEAQRKAKEGKAYNAVAVEVHYDCAE